MFNRLIESQPVRQRHMMQDVVSIVVHVVVIALAIRLTRAAAAPAPAFHMNDVAPVFRAPLRPAPAAVSAGPTVRGAAPPVSWVVATPRISVPVSVAGPAITPRFDASRLNAPDGLAGIPSGVSAEPSLPTELREYTANEVDQAARYVGGPVPVYPPALQQLRLTGHVTLRYIVGIRGRVEPGSILVLSSTNAAFEAPAIAAIDSASFTPGRFRGQPVRQLVEQVIRFEIP